MTISKIWKQSFILGLTSLLLSNSTSAQSPAQIEWMKKNNPRQAQLEELIKESQWVYEERKALAIQRASEKGIALKIEEPNGRVLELIDFDAYDLPVYAGVDNDQVAATISVNRVYPSASNNLNLSGRGFTARQWDGGRVGFNHLEFRNRQMTQGDGNPNVDDHATHVGGTILARGATPRARGMAYEATMRSFDYGNPVNEQATEAANGAMVGNHSWSEQVGWRPGTQWIWSGNPNSVTDERYGYYSASARAWDNLAYNAKYYLIVKSAGNDRGNGPRPGEQYLEQQTNTVKTQPAANDPAYRAPSGPYDCMANFTNSKNLLVVGAVNGNNNGYTGPTSVVMSSFSAWGPTDDGRIKPDLVSDGVGVYSPVDDGQGYSIYSGTSMSTPSITGAVVLLQEQYSNTHNKKLMTAALTKALLINTTDEAGQTPGPDYVFGWGQANILRAANHIGSDSATTMLLDGSIAQGEVINLPVTVQGGRLDLTMVWNDPPATVLPLALNNRTPRLINDLDLRVKDQSGNVIGLPWRLNPEIPTAAATLGDNIVDNVERINLSGLADGNYTIEITHKGDLQNNLQEYALAISGISGPLVNNTCKPVVFYNATTGSFNDGSHGKVYQKLADCVYQIDNGSTNSGLVIRLDSNLIAAGDSLKIYRGEFPNGVLVAAYGENSGLGAHTLTGGKGYIRFTSDNDIEGQGWKVSYYSLFLPAISIVASRDIACSGTTVTIAAQKQDPSDTTSLTYEWVINGATNPTPSGQVVDAVFAVPGVYGAQVTARNAIGEVVVTNNTLVTVNNGEVFQQAYAEERFTNESFPVNNQNQIGNWTMTNSLSPTAANWSRNTLAFVSPPASVAIRNNGIVSGTIRELISPVYDLSNLPPNAFVTFRLAAGRRTSSDNDQMRLLYSIDCGASWVWMSYTRNSTTNPSIYTSSTTTTGIFLPESDEWRTERVRLPIAMGRQPRVQFKFEVTSRGGNFLYLDDFMVGDSATASGLNSSFSQQIKIFPNPASTGSELVIEGLDTDNAIGTISIADLYGRVLTTQMLRRSIKLPSGLAKGMYWVTITADGKSGVKRLLIE